MRLAAVVLAAGLSSRMGQFKPLLPLSGGTVLSHALNAFAGLAPAIVICGNRAEELAPEVRALGARPVLNPDFETGMFSSVLAGVAALPPDVEAFFVLPVDVPLVRPSTPRLLAEDWAAHRVPVTYARFCGERGHPPLLDASLVQPIMQHPGKDGLRGLLAGFEAEARDVDVADRGVLFDLDRPEDYQQARERALALERPSPDEVRALWDLAGTPEPTRAHCRAVAAAALALGRALNAARPDMAVDLELVRAAGLLHDVAKTERRHEQAGGEFLRRHGFPDLAGPVAEHRDLSLGPGARLGSREIVFLADKFVRGTQILPLRERYMEKIRQWAHEPEAKSAIEGRLARAELVLARYELLTGVSALNVIGGAA